jgi:hypothetical protein
MLQEDFAQPEEAWAFLGQQVMMHYTKASEVLGKVFEETALRELLRDPEKGHGGK